jgi:hypothetical protein
LIHIIGHKKFEKNKKNKVMKAYTDLSQSKKLARVLPLKSADMYYHNRVDMPDNYPLLIEWKHNSPLLSQEIPCWSLAALLDVLDDIVVDDEGNEYSLTISKEEGMYYIYYHDRWGEVDDIETDCYYDLVDACYEMIIKLHELNLL